MWKNYQIASEEFQKHYAPASYWKNPFNYEFYLKHSPWLAEANNEREYTEERRQRMLDLNKALFIKWDAETTISPPESSWWGDFDEHYNVRTRFETTVYQQDLIGIKTLEEEKRATFIHIPGKHMAYNFTQIDEIIIPFLIQ